MLQVCFSPVNLILLHTMWGYLHLLSQYTQTRREMFCSIQMNTIMQTKISLTDYILNVYRFIFYLYRSVVRLGVYSPGPAELPFTLSPFSPLSPFLPAAPTDPGSPFIPITPVGPLFP